MSKRETELAWAAGFFDGEGCTSVSKQRDKKYTRISISQNHPEVLCRFRDAVGVGIVCDPTIRADGRVFWQYWVHHRQEIEEVARLISPYLSSLKIIQMRGKLDEGDIPRLNRMTKREIDQIMKYHNEGLNSGEIESLTKRSKHNINSLIRRNTKEKNKQT